MPLLVLMSLATNHEAIRALLLGGLHLRLQVLYERLEVEVAVRWCLPLVLTFQGGLFREQLRLK